MEKYEDKTGSSIIPLFSEMGIEQESNCLIDGTLCTAETVGTCEETITQQLTNRCINQRREVRSELSYSILNETAYSMGNSNQQSADTQFQSISQQELVLRFIHESDGEKA